ncbi:3-phosphoshikimate 1-carboxyvinyltransferase [Jatrophihabitans sp.]|uniref:3-phosphoshikimate 1-carboxyvinyltransferase n=1 Tax=Jatrophihabitans sp. TaxID=1932789 RepID=UPI002C78BA54|nr:3-phosphoshikimate 1-carboxyvinyltransferase [Jatrophihabitans sp.]
MTAPAGSSGRPWAAPTAAGPVTATVELPGSKSLTNRALVLAALSENPVRISAPLRARDTLLMAAALRSLGAGVREDGPDWLVEPAALHGGPVDCGLAGTVMRFVPPLAALAGGDSSFDGDPAARVRPMRVLLDGLRQAGAAISDDGRGTLPFTVHGTGSVPGGLVRIDAAASSQFVSALLLAGARFDDGLELVHDGPGLPSLPHIEMTVAALRAAGVSVADGVANRWQVSPGPIRLPDQVIEPDLSNAAPFLAAALVTGGSVTVPGWPPVTSQPGALLAELLSSMGATVIGNEAGLTVTGSGAISPLEADLHAASELTPVLVALAALADGESVITGVAHIRGHETDRLAALAAELTGLGGQVRETADGLVVRPVRLHGGRWHSYADHRMAQAGAVLGLAVPGVEVDDIGCTSKTLADFEGMWQRLLDPTDAAQAER